MNREIKFRGKRVDNGNWIIGGYVEWSDIRDNKHYQIVSSAGCHNDIISETIGQFTELHDKNSKEIYEGDIVKFEPTVSKGMKLVPSGYELTGIVSLNMYNHPCIYAFNTPCLDREFHIENAMKGEVIGNINDNPELINK